MALASSAPSQPKDKDSSTPIKTRTEKQDRFVRILQRSLSEKISEKFAAIPLDLRDDDGENIYSPSPSSTVSSSGEVEGIYTLHSDEGTTSSDNDNDSGELSCDLL